MQYEQYQSKIKKIAAVLAKIYAVRVAIITVLAVAAVLAVSAVAAKGAIISEDPCPAEVIYGETPTYKATAFWGDVSFEYRKAGETEWQTTGTDVVGDYQVRAVSTSAFGNPRYGDVQNFKVIPRPITPVVTATEAIYGETPAVSAAMVGGDILSCGVVYESFEIRVTESSGGSYSAGWNDLPVRERIATVRVDPATVRVTDAEGNDRTDCYTVADTPTAEITLTPRPLTVTVGDADKVYDGVALSFDGYEISEGTLAEGDTLLAVFGNSITIAGTLMNTPNLQVIAADGQNVTLLYDIFVVSGTLTVEKRPLIVETGSATLTYNGFEQTHPLFTVDPTTPLVSGQEITVDTAPALRDCGTTPNTLTFSITSKMRENFTDNYSIFIKPGTLTVTPREITVCTDSAEFVYDGQTHEQLSAKADLPEGESLVVIMNNAKITDVGSVENTMTVIVIRGSDNVTDNYIITYEYGTLTVTPRPVVVYITDAAKVYDGTPLTSNAFTVAEHLNSKFSLVEGHVLTLETDGSVVFGEGENKCVEGSILIRDQSLDTRADYAKFYNRDVTANYDITVLPGTLTVTPRPVTVAAADASKIYDGTPLTAAACTALDDESNPDDGLVEGHSLHAAAMGSQTEVGKSQNSVDTDTLRITDAEGADVTACYDVTTREGLLEVTPCRIRVGTATGEWVYDGRPHSDGTLTILEVLDGGVFPAHHTLVCVTNPLPTLTDVGMVENILEAAVMEGERSVTHNYEITYEYGTLTVTPRPITVTTATHEWVYDAYTHPIDPSDLPAPRITEGTLAEGQRMITAQEAFITTVGETENIQTVFILDEAQNDVTHNYTVTREYGTLTVVKRPITVRTPDVEWVYDGQAHEITEGYALDETSPYDLAHGHWMTVDTTSSRPTYRDAGVYTNRQTVLILSENPAAEVMSNYEVSYVEGTITILHRPLIISLHGVKVYDDQPLAGDEVRVVYEGEYLPCEGHTLTVLPVETITDAGYLASRADPATLQIKNGSEDVAYNYTVTYNGGGFIIHPRPLGVKSYDAAKVYDGTPLTEPRGTTTEVGRPLPKGHILYVDAYGSGVQVGTYSNTVNPARIRVTNADGVDKTYNYDLLSVWEGTLTILPEPVAITVTTGSDEKIFDGSPLICEEYTTAGQEGLPVGYRLEVSDFPAISTPGSMDNQPKIQVIAPDGSNAIEDLVDLYTDFGSLTVHPLPEGMEPDSIGIVLGEFLPAQDGIFYLRQYSTGEFNRQVWLPTAKDDYPDTLVDGYGYQYLTSTAMSMLGYTPSQGWLRGMLEFLLPYYPNPDGLAPAVGSDTRNSPDLWRSDYGVNYFYSDNQNHPVTRYMALSEAERATLLGEFADEELAYRAHVYERYLYVHPETRAFLQEIIDEQGFDLSDPKLILKVASYIQHAAEYDADPQLAYRIETSEDAVIAFLRDYKKGLCRHYASAAAMLYRTLGIPARYTVGFMMQQATGGEWNEIISGGPNNMAHAWVEVYLDGLGWVAVEVTGGSGGGGGFGSQMNAEKPTLELTPVFCTKVYDGTYLYTDPRTELTHDLEALLSQGYTYSMTVSGQQLEVGQSDSTILEFTLYDPDGHDVTDHYNVIKHKGLLKVTENPVELFLYPQEKVYDGRSMDWYDEDYEILSLPEGYSLTLDIHVSSYEAGMVSLSELNRNPETYTTVRIYDPAGADVTNYFTVVFVQPAGMEPMPVLEIRQRVIELTAASEIAVYGQVEEALTNPSVRLSLGRLVDGHTLEATAMGRQAVIGSSPNVVNLEAVVIRDADGVDVTDNYRIIPINGELTLLEDR